MLVGVCVFVGVCDGVSVGVGVDVSVGVDVRVAVAVCVGVFVIVGVLVQDAAVAVCAVAVSVACSSALGPQAVSNDMNMINTRIRFFIVFPILFFYVVLIFNSPSAAQRVV